jgi:hypothetical protein
VIAGVIIPSPYSSDAPTIPSRMRSPRPRDDCCGRRISAVNARMPPSPWLSARITSTMYLIETIRMSE